MLRSLPLQNTGVIFGISRLPWLPSSCHFVSMIHSDNFNQLLIEKSIIAGVHCHFVVRTIVTKQSKTTLKASEAHFFYLCVLLPFCDQGEIIFTKISITFLYGYNPKRKIIIPFYHPLEKY